MVNPGSQVKQTTEKPKSEPQTKKSTASEAKAAKEAKKLAKQNRRAESKAAAGGLSGALAPGGQQQAGESSSPSKQRQTFQGPKGATGKESQKGGKGQQQQQATGSKPKQAGEVQPIKKSTPFLSHLEGDRPPIDVTKPHADVHPAVTELSIKLKSFEIAGSSARCLYMLRAFQYV